MATTSPSRVSHYHLKPQYASNGSNNSKIKLEERLKKARHDIDVARINLHLTKSRWLRRGQLFYPLLMKYATTMSTGASEAEGHAAFVHHPKISAFIRRERERGVSVEEILRLANEMMTDTLPSSYVVRAEERVKETVEWAERVQLELDKVVKMEG